MVINSIAESQSNYVYGLEKDKKNPSVEVGDPPQPEPVEASALMEESEEASEQKGVIRNLLNGHYKGAADVRLRLNFGDELAQLESSQVSGIMAEPPPELADLQADLDQLSVYRERLPKDSPLAQAMTDLEARVEAFASQDEMTAGQAKEAIEELRLSLDDFLSEISVFLAQTQAAQQPNGTPDPESVFLAEELTTPETVEPIAETPPMDEPSSASVDQAEPVVEPDIEPPAPSTEEQVDGVLLGLLEGFLAKWRSTPVKEASEAQAAEVEPGLGAQIDGQSSVQDVVTESPVPSAGDALRTKLDELLAGLDNITAPPPLSGPPDNNGIAYSKFLATYQGMFSPQPDEMSYPGAEAPEGFDQVV